MWGGGRWCNCPSRLWPNVKQSPFHCLTHKIFRSSTTTYIKECCYILKKSRWICLPLFNRIFNAARTNISIGTITLITYNINQVGYNANCFLFGILKLKLKGIESEWLVNSHLLLGTYSLIIKLYPNPLIERRISKAKFSSILSRSFGLFMIVRVSLFLWWRPILAEAIKNKIATLNDQNIQAYGCGNFSGDILEFISIS